MTFSLDPHVTTTETDTGLVLLDERSGRYWHMNDTGAITLRCLLDGGTTETAVATLRERFPGAGEEVEADVRQLVSALRAAGVVA